MANTFSFGFDGNDIDREEAEGVDVQDVLPEETRIDPATAIDPEKHSLEHMLSFIPSQISYSSVEIHHGKNSTFRLPRRVLHDIRHQIMTEDTMKDSEPQHGLTAAGDITPKIYEGGFKTWECSIDLASMLAEDYNTVISGRDPAHTRLNLLELGAGSALPSLVIFRSLLSRPKTDYQSSPAVYFTLCDYNVSVLTHSTLPNFLLVWCASKGLLRPPTGDIEITPELIERFTIDLADRKIHIYGISGAWGPALVDLLAQMHGDEDHPVRTLVLASETIYDTSTLASFTETLTSTMRIAERNGGIGCGMVAVKLVYFGVGGGVDDFKEELNKMGGQSKVLWENIGVGVGRVILGVSLRKFQIG